MGEEGKSSNRRRGPAPPRKPFCKFPFGSEIIKKYRRGGTRQERGGKWAKGGENKNTACPCPMNSWTQYRVQTMPPCGEGGGRKGLKMRRKKRHMREEREKKKVKNQRYPTMV